ncbi:MAG: LysR family transcriptional regulator, partial [Acidobacteriota bacterium]
MIDDLRHIRAFLTAARTGNFTRAAVEMHISQSAFTVQIRQLEDALGVALFDRSKRRVALTSAGRELLVPLERVLVDVESIVSCTRELAGLRRGIVHVGVLPSMAVGLLPEAIRKFSQVHPGITVQVSDIVGEKLIEAVKKEEVDFGVGCRIRVDREIKTTPLFADRLCAFVPKA